MKLNAHHSISTTKVLLVPYSERHVPTYHTWMKDPALQEATASEPLSLHEEYAMQRSWREDHDKLTFIICLPLTSRTEAGDVCAGVDDAPEKMVGDINLFLFPFEDDEDSELSLSNGVIGEIELMVAHPSSRRQGYGRAALLAFVDYIVDQWSPIQSEYISKSTASLAPEQHASKSSMSGELRYLRVKINESNLGSVHLFESVGFKRTAEQANYFGEIELRWSVTDNGRLSSVEDRAELLDYNEALDTRGDNVARNTVCISRSRSR